eukprot:14866694-Ditylum_brightwellii.AAC.1
MGCGILASGAILLMAMPGNGNFWPNWLTSSPSTAWSFLQQPSLLTGPSLAPPKSAVTLG